MIVSDAHAFSIQSVFSPAWVFTDVADLVTTILQTLISAAGALALVFIIMSGIKFVTGSGDPQKIAAARNTLFFSIIGLAIATLAFIIVEVVQTVAGGGSFTGSAVTCQTADVNRDRRVNSQDFAAISRATSLPYNSRYDVNRDGVVNADDLNAAATVFNCAY